LFFFDNAQLLLKISAGESAQQQQQQQQQQQYTTPPSTSSPPPPYSWSSTLSSAFNKAFPDSKASSNAKMSNRHERVWGGNLPPGVFTREDVDASTYIGGLLAEDELDWMTLFNVSTGTTKEISGGNAIDGLFLY
uniref:COesterase domain-containing protein n=1 Tax=Gongylonema pulchrum TaxID=637853 RepID=A0A183ET24_9BILA